MLPIVLHYIFICGVEGQEFGEVLVVVSRLNKFRQSFRIRIRIPIPAAFHATSSKHSHQPRAQ